MKKPYAAPTARTRRAQCRNVGRPERWASLLAGATLSGWGLRRRTSGAAALGTLGGMLLYRGMSGHCMVYRQLGISSARPDEVGLLGRDSVELHTRVRVARPPEVVYRYWRTLENLPRFLRHLKRVRAQGNRSRWEAVGLFGRTVTWDAEITHDTPNERIAWRSVAGAAAQHRGEVLFRSAPRGEGTEVELRLSYRPRGGAATLLAAKLLGGVTERVIHRDMARFKEHMETQALPPARPPQGRIPDQGLGPEPITPSHG